jgi:hypothetical protein
VLGGGLEGDLVAEGLELGDGPLAGTVAVTSDEEVAAKVVVVAVPSSRYQQITRMEWPTATAAFFLPMRRASRQNWAAR